MGATERTVQLIEYLGITKYKFCKTLGFSNKFLDNSSNMGTDKAGKILHHFPFLMSDWLLTGVGDMLDWNKKEAFVDGRGEVVKRLSLYLANKGIGIAEVNSTCGWSRGNLQKRIDKDQIEASHLYLITKTYSDLNPQWLMLGDGEVKRNAISHSSNESSITKEQYQQLEEKNAELKAEIEVLESKVKQIEQDKQNQQSLINFLQTQSAPAQKSPSPHNVMK